jgi:DNA-binding NtrC family response regulator
LAYVDAVLIVEDDAAIAKVVRGLLEQRGLATSWAETAEEALKQLEKRAFDLVLSDVRLPGMDGVGLLDRVRAGYPELPVILITAHGSVALAVDAMKRGAADFVQKPFDRDELIFCIEKALAASRTRRAAPPETVGRPVVAMPGVLAKIDKVAPTTATVLVRGETGTGKELVARAIHERSPRKNGPFVVVHCAALPETLLESELFGHEKGAFTGATQRKPGRIELAHHGTLFLDEIGDVPLAMQVKLLRVVQEREFERLGGRETVKVDVRFVAATHRDLEKRIAEGHFREDLYYRLNVVPVDVPPLRERTEEIPALVRAFAGDRIDEAGIALLAAQPWPGNVRQLEHFVERVLVLSDTHVISRAEIARELEGDGRPAGSSAMGGIASLDDQRKDVERSAVMRALLQAGDNRTKAARILGVSRRTFYNKLKEHGLE